MSELNRDPAIKLFGRTIPLHESKSNPTAVELSPEQVGEPEKLTCKETEDTETKDPDSDNPNQTGTQPEPIPSISGNLTGEKDKPDSKPNDTKLGSDAVLGPEKTLKKPDKILPCPRCNSMETKFCYYNNYNVNQPRHFCKNCQRYWTAGGTMRNVPVGAGRRKNKHSSSHYRHIMMTASESLLHQPATIPCGPHSPVPGPGTGTGTGTVLKFGTEVPLCESMATVLNIGDKTNSGNTTDLGREEQSCASSSRAETGEKNSTQAHVNTTATNNNNNNNGFAVPPPTVHCYPGPAFMCPWGGPPPPGWQFGPEKGNPGPVPFNPQPGFFGPAIPFPFIPASVFGWPNGPWSVPWTGFTNGGILPTSPTTSSGSGNGSPTLGKHLRDTDGCNGEEKMERNLWVPKTLRIVDPDEAAKSSIWATLGIKPDKESVFKSFGGKEKNNCQLTDAAQVLQANPAALSRSQSFQENT